MPERRSVTSGDDSPFATVRSAGKGAERLARIARGQPCGGHTLSLATGKQRCRPKEKRRPQPRVQGHDRRATFRAPMLEGTSSQRNPRVGPVRGESIGQERPACPAQTKTSRPSNPVLDPLNARPARPTTRLPMELETSYPGAGDRATTAHEKSPEQRAPGRRVSMGSVSRDGRLWKRTQSGQPIHRPAHPRRIKKSRPGGQDGVHRASINYACGLTD